jgi:hypothetical protein
VSPEIFHGSEHDAVLAGEKYAVPTLSPEEGDSFSLRNINIYRRVYMAPKVIRRTSSSYW